MFNDFQRDELVGRLRLVLEQEKAGKADNRQALAETLVAAAREYLASQFKDSKTKADGGLGVTRGHDVIGPGDFPPA